MLKKSASALKRATGTPNATGAIQFEVRGSKFRKPRTSDLEPSSVSPVPPVSLGHWLTGPGASGK